MGEGGEGAECGGGDVDAGDGFLLVVPVGVFGTGGGVFVDRGCVEEGFRRRLDGRRAFGATDRRRGCSEVQRVQRRPGEEDVHVRQRQEHKGNLVVERVDLHAGPFAAGDDGVG